MDALKILNHVLDGKPYDSEIDMNSDGNVNIFDILLIIDIILGRHIPPTKPIQPIPAETPTPTYEYPNYARWFLTDGFEMHANDDLSILYFTNNGNIIIEILPELDSGVSDYEVPENCMVKILTKHWGILYPIATSDDITKMELRFLFKGKPQTLITPYGSGEGTSNNEFNGAIYFSEFGRKDDAFWAIKTKYDEGITFWFRESLEADKLWVSQSEITTNMAGYTSIIREIDIEKIEDTM